MPLIIYRVQFELIVVLFLLVLHFGLLFTFSWLVRWWRTRFSMQKRQIFTSLEKLLQSNSRQLSYKTSQPIENWKLNTNKHNTIHSDYITISGTTNFILRTIHRDGTHQISSDEYQLSKSRWVKTNIKGVATETRITAFEWNAKSTWFVQISQVAETIKNQMGYR